MGHEAEEPVAGHEGGQVGSPGVQSTAGSRKMGKLRTCLCFTMTLVTVGGGRA